MHPRREDHREAPDVHVSGICYRKADHSVLLMRRSLTRALYPGLWEGCGGQLRRGESFAAGVVRHYRDELGVDVIVDESDTEVYFIEGAGIPGVRFCCFWQAGEPRLTNHSESRWVPIAEFEEMSADLFPPGFKQQANKLLNFCSFLTWLDDLGILQKE